MKIKLVLLLSDCSLQDAIQPRHFFLNFLTPTRLYKCPPKEPLGNILQGQCYHPSRLHHNQSKLRDLK